MLNRKTFLSALVAFLAAMVAGTALAQIPAPGQPERVDPRVENAVRLLGYDFDVMKKGSVAVLVPVGSGKARIVIVESQTRYENGNEARLMSSICRVYEGEIPQPVAEVIRDVNQNIKAGQFVVLEQDGKKILVFVVLIKADLSADELAESIKATCKVAARMSEMLGQIN